MVPPAPSGQAEVAGIAGSREFPWDPAGTIGVTYGIP